MAAARLTRNHRQRAKGNGGSPCNILKNLAKLGAQVPLEAIGLAGNDEDGRSILSDGEAHGIDAAHLKATARAATGSTDVMTVHGGGRRTFFHSRGANASRPDGCGEWCASLKIPVESIKGAAGAGDAFAAGVLLGLHETWPTAKGLTLGVCTAAACLAEVACSAGVRSMAERLELALRWGFQELSCIGATGR
jgi:sugar/nucleoside kinase (ribokinase family)